MLEFIRDGASERRLRLAITACVRVFWEQINDDLRAVVTKAEMCADRAGGTDEIRACGRHLYEDYGSPRSPPENRNWLESSNRSQALFSLVFATTYSPSLLSRLDKCSVWNYGIPLVKHQLPDILRDIFGNPFRPVPIDPSWLSPMVVSLALGIYEEKAFDRMPILADALQDTGCENIEVLQHCRGNVPHVRGCRLIDLLLGKE